MRATHYLASLPFMFSQCDGGLTKTQRPLLLKPLAYNRLGESTSSNHHSSLKAFNQKGTRKKCGWSREKEEKNPTNSTRNSIMLSSDLSFDQEQTLVKKTGWVHQVPKHKINPCPGWTASRSYQHLNVSSFFRLCHATETAQCIINQPYFTSCPTLK